MREFADRIASRREVLAGVGTAGLAAALPIGAFAKSGPATVPSSVDLTGGLPADREYFLKQPPAVDGFADAASFWIWDNCGLIGFPRVAVEAVSPDRQTNQMQMALTFADGRILRNLQPGTPHPTVGADGRSNILGAGPIRFECVEPYRRYRTAFKGTAVDTTFQALLEGRSEDRRVDLEYEVECDAIVPPWAQGTMATGFERWAREGVQGGFIGGERLEQLMRATARVKVGGVELTFTGGALRVRRQGVRNTAGMWGHCWQSAVFPSGRAFGCISYPTRSDQEPSYNEGYIFLGKGKIIPARVVEAPWLKQLSFNRDDVSLVLESRLGRTRIDGELVMGVPIPATARSAGMSLPKLQSISRFRWDDEITYGMTDRSNLAGNILPPT